jgi:hypothetical protein
MTDMREETTDLAISIFRLTNSRGYRSPVLNVEYTERETHNVWQIVSGGTRAYLAKFGRLECDFAEQAADSHFMVRRTTSSLLLGGAGLFQAEAAGRLIFMGIKGRDFNWSAHLDDSRDPEAPKDSAEVLERVGDWYRSLCEHTVLRRAADDAHIALTYPHEALVFVYRGLEWLKEGLEIEWDELARDIGASTNELRELKKNANHETGVRHATKSGSKIRANAENYSSWVAALLHAINAARKRLDANFQPLSPEQIFQAVLKAVPIVPYD